MSLLTPTQLSVPQPQHTQLSQGEEKYLIFSKITPSINTIDTVCNNIYVLKTTTFWYVQVQRILRTQQIQIHLLPSLTEKDNGLIYQRTGNLPHYAIVLKCALHTLRFMSATPRKTKNNIKLLTPSINKWFCS